MAIGNQTGASGGPIVLNADGTNGCTVNWTISGNPTGMTLSTATGSSTTLSWSNVATGTYNNIQVKAVKQPCYINGADCCAGNPPPAKCVATDTFTLTVGSSCPPNPLTISEGASSSPAPPMFMSVPIDPCAANALSVAISSDDLTSATGSAQASATGSVGAVAWELVTGTNVASIDQSGRLTWAGLASNRPYRFEVRGTDECGHVSGSRIKVRPA